MRKLHADMTPEEIEKDREVSKAAYEKRMARLREETLEAERITGLRGAKARRAYIERFGGFPK